MKSEATTLPWMGCEGNPPEGVVIPGAEDASHHGHAKMIICCAGCGRPIMDKYLLTVLDRTWHTECVRCVDCGSSLSDKCFSRDDKLYCRTDFFRRFGKKCSGCLEGISPSELIRKARDRVYHIKCFTCFVCRKQLSTGEELYVLTANKFVCKQDYNANKFIVEGDCGPPTDDDDEELDIKPPLLETNNNNTNSNNNNNPPPPPGGSIPPHLGSPQTSLSLNPHSIPSLSSSVNSPPLPSLMGGLMGGDSGVGSSSIPPPPPSSLLHDHNSSGGDSKSSLGLGGYTMGLSSTPTSDKDLNTFHDSEASDGEAGSESKDMSGKLPDDDKNGNKRRGPRTTIKAKQLEILKIAFNNTPKPTRHIREQLAKETGLPMRVIQVWFQNKRSKERRMKQLTSMGMRAHLFANPRKLRGMRMSPGMEEAYQYYGDAFGYPPQGFHEFFPGQVPPPHMGFHDPIYGGLPPAMEQPLPPGGPLTDFGGLGSLGLPPPPPDTPHFLGGQPPELMSQRSSPDGISGGNGGGGIGLGMQLSHGGPLQGPGPNDPQVSEGLVW